MLSSELYFCLSAHKLAQLLAMYTSWFWIKCKGIAKCTYNKLRELTTQFLANAFFYNNKKKISNKMTIFREQATTALICLILCRSSNAVELEFGFGDQKGGKQENPEKNHWSL